MGSQAALTAKESSTDQLDTLKQQYATFCIEEHVSSRLLDVSGAETVSKSYYQKLS